MTRVTVHRSILIRALLAMLVLSPIGYAGRAKAALCWPPTEALDLISVAPADPVCRAAVTPAQPSERREAIGLLGEKVRGPADEDLGQIIDVIVDRSGQPVAAIIDFGGFLGVGSRKVAVDWRALTFEPTSEPPVRLAIGRAEIQAAPEYKRGAAVITPLGQSAPPVEPSPPVEPPPPDKSLPPVEPPPPVKPSPSGKSLSPAGPAAHGRLPPPAKRAPSSGDGATMPPSPARGK